jgi:molybdopterin molybdotransferase
MSARPADWLTIDEALARILEHCEPLGAEPVALDAAAGRTLAEPVISPIDQPPWDNSAMDGYAVHAASVRGASETSPVTLRVVEEVKAGGVATAMVNPGEAVRIMTGAPVPAGVDSVVRVEHTRTLDDGRVAIHSDADAGRNIRMRGEDVRAGASVFTPGRLLRPAEVGVLAMLGHVRPRVAVKPRVAILATGDELVEADRLADVLAGTHIINSNTPALAAAIAQTGCTAEPLGIARDELPDLRRRLEPALDADALITTAGASMGDHDLVKDALEQLGFETLFWRVKIRPGSPFSFGILRRPGRHPLPVFGLPGNPVSVLVTFEILVRPALRRMLGRSRIYPPVIAVRAGADVRSPPGLMRFLRVRMEPGDDGIPVVHLTGPQGSGILTSVAAADALLIVPIDVDRIGRGEAARAVPLLGADDAAPELHLERAPV